MTQQRAIPLPLPSRPATTRRRLLGLISAAPALALMPRAVRAAEVTIETAQGPVGLTPAPRRLAVYDPAAFDTLLALGQRPAGVPDRFHAPALDRAARGMTRIGTLFEPDLEALAALAPDLVIVGGRSAAQRASVARLAPAIDMTIGVDVPASARARLLSYGRLFGAEARATAMAHSLDTRIATAKAAAEGKGRSLIVLVNGPKLSAFGRGSRFGWPHGTLGLPEAAPTLKPALHGAAVSFEFIAEADPDWIFVIDRAAVVGKAGAAARQTLDTPLVQGTRAAKAGHIVYLDPANVYIASGGYTATMATLAQVTDALRA